MNIKEFNYPVCPLHETKLIYIDSCMMGCTETITRKVKGKFKTWKCPHIQFDSKKP